MVAAKDGERSRNNITRKGKTLVPGIKKAAKQLARMWQKRNVRV